MKIEHILLDSTQHFLVIEGKRGPLEIYGSRPATHPSGYFRYRSDAYDVPKMLKGVLFSSADLDVDEKRMEVCAPADKAYTEWVEITKTCNEVVLARYEEAK